LRPPKLPLGDRKGRPYGETFPQGEAFIVFLPFFRREENPKTPQTFFFACKGFTKILQGGTLKTL